MITTIPLSFARSGVFWLPATPRKIRLGFYLTGLMLLFLANIQIKKKSPNNLPISSRYATFAL